jgi:hypothetical protein
MTCAEFGVEPSVANPAMAVWWCTPSSSAAVCASTSELAGTPTGATLDLRSRP